MGLRVTIIVPRNSLAEVVGLQRGSMIAEIISGKLPVDLVGVVGHEHGAGDNAYPRGRLEHHLHRAVVQVAARPHGGDVALLAEGEDGPSARIELEVAIVGENPI